ncbi:MAG: periplasmic heavy metal sensor [Burkholderiales bacterium]|nr:periplasmic heavy metal sensor [Burkholderiales bacterium]
MNSRKSSWIGITAAALLAFGSYAAFAQPGGGAMRHGHGQGIEIEGVLAHLKDQLGLDTSQQVMWDNAVAQSKAARGNGRASREQLRATLGAELAKAEPDFAAVATAADATQANNQALRRQVRDEWLKLYATFSPAQKAVVRDAVKARLARMDSFRERMREHGQSRKQGAG